MKMRNLICLLMLTFTGSLFAQTISFRADQVTVPPSELTADKGVQVGLYMTTTGNGTESWSQINVRVNYTLNGGAVLAGDPIGEVSSYVGTDNAQPGISNPGTPVDGSTFAGADIINVATLGGASVNFMPNLDPAATQVSGGIFTEDVNNITQVVTLSVLGTQGDFFTTEDDTEYLVGIVEFPFDETSPFGSWVTVDFDPAPAANFIQNSARRAIIDAQGNNTDGYALIFDTLDCSGATAADNLGTASGSDIEIDYLDPQAGGVGGDITLTLPHGTTDPVEIRVVPSDGSGEIVLTGGQIGVGSTTLDLTTQGDGTPATAGASVTYDIFYSVNNPLGGTSEGDPCSVTVTWAAPTCTIAADAIPVVGNPVNFDVTLSNVVWSGTEFGTVTLPDASVIALTAPSSTTGNVLNFDDAVMIASVDAMDVGSYTVDANGADGSAVAGCSAFLGLECPTNNTVCPTTEVAIGGTLDITLAGDNVATWDIIYNGDTFADIPGTDTMFTLTNLVGDATTYTVRANGFDDMGDPCSDDVVCDINFADATCTTDSVTWDDNGTITDVCPDGVDVNEMVTVTITTTGATGAFIPAANIGAGSDVQFVETAGTFGVDDVVTAEATFMLSVLGTIDYVVEGPVGTTEPSNCDFEACLSTFVTGGDAFLDGASLCFNGTPNFTFEIYAVPGSNCTDIPFGANVTLGDLGGSPQLVGTITTDGNGDGCVVLGEDGTIFVPDACYYIVFNGQVFGGTQNAAVPTLGEWGMIAFIMLLMGAAVFQQRKRRMA